MGSDAATRVRELTVAGPDGPIEVTLVTPAHRNGAAVILAHGGTADGRRFFVDAARELAGDGLTVALPATRTVVEPRLRAASRRS
jgi:dienelactone hydrolase